MLYLRKWVPISKFGGARVRFRVCLRLCIFRFENWAIPAQVTVTVLMFNPFEFNTWLLSYRRTPFTMISHVQSFFDFMRLERVSFATRHYFGYYLRIGKKMQINLSIYICCMLNVRALLNTPLDVREYMHAGVFFDIFFPCCIWTSYHPWLLTHHFLLGIWTNLSLVTSISSSNETDTDRHRPRQADQFYLINETT